MNDRKPIPSNAIESRLDGREVDRTTESECRRVDSATLFGNAREVVITHRGETYRLHVTRNEKLILTK